MSYRPLRKDLTNTTRECFFCLKQLNSLKAFVLLDEVSGEVVFAGPTCAKKKIGAGHSLAGLPDLTRYTLPAGEREDVDRHHQNDGAIHQLDPEQRAIEYLYLREDKLAAEMHTSYHVLTNYFLKQKSGSLSQNDILHINNIEAKAPDKFKRTTLLRCYNYLFWLDLAIEKLPAEKRNFLISIRNILIHEGEISEKQKASVNKWFERIDGLPQIR